MPMLHGLSPHDRPHDHGAIAEAARLAALLDVLGDPTRLAILRHLQGGEHRVVKLTEHLGLAQSTVSQHLAILRSAGLVSTHSHGRASVNRLEHADLLDTLLTAATHLADGAAHLGDTATSHTPAPCTGGTTADPATAVAPHRKADR